MKNIQGAVCLMLFVTSLLSGCQAQEGGCCSWNLKECEGDEWCSMLESQCLECGGVWIVPANNDPNCVARWDGCSATSDCCGEGSYCGSFEDYAGCGFAQDFPDRPPKATEGCCSWNLKDCNDDDVWCSMYDFQCNECGGAWIITNDNSPDCLARWEGGCSSDDDCCGVGTSCGEFEEYVGCGLPEDFSGVPTQATSGCCSWNLKDCFDDEWCSMFDYQCEECGGFWIVTATQSPSCLARWAGGCTVDEDCCGEESSCGQFDGYTGCGLPEDFIDAPFTSPTEAGTVAPTNDPFEIPTGSNVPSGYSELITIPQPPNPIILEGDARTNCPHTDTGLRSWVSLGLTPALEGADVFIPENTRVLLDSSVPIQLGLVTVPASSELIIGESSQVIEVNLSGLLVLGKLIAGSETCRIETPVTLTFHGSRPGDAVQNPPNPEVKGISCQGCELSLHGKRFYRTWTRLSSTIEPGSRIIDLQDSVNWQIGQEIVLITTALKDSREWHQNEVLVIENILENARGGSSVQVTTAVQYRHIGSMNYQAEVGLLSRTIKIQGSGDDSEPTDPDPLNCQSDKWFQGDNRVPCPNTELTGYGVHIMIHEGGIGKIEGVELFRAGQTNIKARYPIHFHLLGDCPECYCKDSSIHRSYYRCVTIHGTDSMTVSENVAYDVSGFCYYLEDGVETKNTIAFNLAAHIHLIGPEPPQGYGQTTDSYQQSDILTLPADVSASGYYITNTENNVIGNAAVGGWSGFAFPNLAAPLGFFRSRNMRPSSALSMIIDGNTAHSTGWWWVHAGGFYVGGSLWYDDNDVLTYNPGRGFERFKQRTTCAVDLCARGDCDGYCPAGDRIWTNITNSKAFLCAGDGFNAWNGRFQVLGYESHDNGLALETIESGFWADRMLVTCRTGEALAIPDSSSAPYIRADGFFFYDTAQEHILTDSTFRNCGYRSPDFAQYDTSPTRGCGDSVANGCPAQSTVFGFLGHSDQFNPEIMQATSGISFENCGRRFRIETFNGDDSRSTVSGRLLNWIDADGSVTGLGELAYITSGYEDCGLWWKIDDQVIDDEHGPLTFIRASDGPERGLGHINVEWDSSLHSQVGNSVCDSVPLDCPVVGSIRHVGTKYANEPGLPITPASDIVGLVGGFGWLLELNSGAPKTMKISLVEVDSSTPLLLSVAYPPGTSFSITAHASDWCWIDDGHICETQFAAVSSIDQVRESAGNTYYVSPEGVLTLRVVQTGADAVGRPEWFLPSLFDQNRLGDYYVLDRFDRKGVHLMKLWWEPWLDVVADCAGEGAYCSGATSLGSIDDVCPAGYMQVSYDKCCNGQGACVFANG